MTVVDGDRDWFRGTAFRTSIWPANASLCSQSVQERLRVWRCCFNTCRIDPFQQFEGMLALGVWLRTIGGRPRQCIKYVRFRHMLQLFPLAKRLLHEPRAEISAQRVAVCQEPGFRDLNHQKGIVLTGGHGFAPTVVRTQMLPDRIVGLDGSFGVHEKERRRSRCGVRNFGYESLECLLPRAAPYHLRHPAAQTRRLEETRPTCPELCTKPAIVAATLDVKGDGHQRFPPNCPELQRFPSV